MIARSVTALAVLPLLTLLAAANPGSGKHKTALPTGYDGYMVFMANGELPFADLIGDGQAFLTEVMGYSPAQIDQAEADARAFFLERFGITDAHYTSGDVTLNLAAARPEYGYRAYTIAGQNVTKSGWPVRDGAFTVTVVNPGGIDLGGEFAGTHASAGTFLTYGWYNIQKQQKSGKAKGQIVLHFRSNQPILPDVNFNFAFVCDVFSETYGVGKAQGINHLVPRPDGLVKANVRNVLTFSDDGGL